jgi:glycosyltransferase involved in cell wall biosynthesis
MASMSHAIEEYRYLGPLRALHAENRLFYVSVCRPSPNSTDRAPSLTELDRMDPDVLLMHSALDNVRCAALLRYRAHRPDLFRIFSVDDLMTDLPLAHPNYEKFPAEMAKERTELALKASHRLIVSTEPLAEAYRHLIDDIRVIPNALDGTRWEGLVSRRRRGRKLRVGWAGGGQHGGDLILLQGVLEATHTEVDWIFLGSYPDELKPFVAESHAYVHFSKYPEKLASLDLDLGVVPLDMNPFNEAKSNLRLLEYGMLGWPVICTDIYPYRTNDPPVARLPNDTARWIAAIRERVADPDALAREGDALRAWVKRHYLLEKHLDQWRRALLP